MGRMSNGEKVVGKSGQEKKQASLQSWMERLKKGRGVKRRSPSPLPPAPLSFFKVMLGDFRDVLFIPPMAACSLKGLVKKYVHIEDSDANSWRVKVSILDGSLAFQSGWHDFVIDHSITVGEFVLFTYNGELMFTARVFGISSLERVNFQLRKSSNRCVKQRSNAELDSYNVRIHKRQKEIKSSKHRHSSRISESMLQLNKEIEVDLCDFSEVCVNERDSISEKVPEDSSAYWKSPHQSTNTEEPNEGLELDFVQACCTTSDSKIEEKLGVISDTDHILLDGKNHESVVHKSITNGTTSDQRTVHLLDDGTPLTSQEAGKTYSMTKFASSWIGNAHVENKDGAAAMSVSEMQESKRDCKTDCEMEIIRNMEENHSNSLELLSGEPIEDMMVAEYILKHGKHSPKVDVNVSEPEGNDGEVLHKAEGVCYIIDEKTLKFEIEFPCQTTPLDPSGDMLGSTNDEKKDMMPTTEEYEEHQSKVKQEAFTDEDEKDVTPLAWKSPVKMETPGSVEIPLSSCASFSVCVPHDAQPSLELPESMASPWGKKKHKRKVFVLQDPSMKCWPVLYLESLDYLGFIGGWIDFAIANNICKGDVCEFELIDKKKLLFKVNIKKH